MGPRQSDDPVPRLALAVCAGAFPDTLLVTDDMQMQGLQKAMGTRRASLRSLKAGMDMLCIGNNLFDQEQEMAAIAVYIARPLRAAPFRSGDREIDRAGRPAKGALGGLTGTRELSRSPSDDDPSPCEAVETESPSSTEDRRWPIATRSMTTSIISSRARRAAPR